MKSVKINDLKNKYCFANTSTKEAQIFVKFETIASKTELISDLEICLDFFEVWYQAQKNEIY